MPKFQRNQTRWMSRKVIRKIVLNRQSLHQRQNLKKLWDDRPLMLLITAFTKCICRKKKKLETSLKLIRMQLKNGLVNKQ
jgi:hypothetical protein